MKVRKRPRLICDLRRRRLRKSVLKAFFFLVFAAAGVFAALNYSIKLKRDGEKILEEYEIEIRKLPASGMGDALISLRGDLGNVEQKARRIIEIPAYNAPQDVSFLAGTRKSAMMNEARGYTNDYWNALEKRSGAVEGLRTLLERDAREIAGAINAVSGKSLGSPAVDMSRVKSALAHFRSANTIRYPVPGIWHKALIDLESALDAARIESCNDPLAAEIDSVRKKIEEFDGNVDRLRSKIEECDASARHAFDALAALPFGGAERMAEMNRCLDNAVADFDQKRREEANRYSNVKSLSSIVFGKGNELRTASEKMDELKTCHGTNFIKYAEFSAALNDFNSAANSLKDRLAELAKKYSAMEGECEKRIKDVQTFKKESSSAEAGDIAAIERACGRIGNIVAEIGRQNFTWYSNDDHRGVQDDCKRAIDFFNFATNALKYSENAVGDWQEVENNITRNFRSLAADARRASEIAVNAKSDLSSADGDEVRKFTGRADELLDQYRELAGDIPDAARIENGLQADGLADRLETLRHGVEDYKKRCERFKNDFTSAEKGGGLRIMRYERLFEGLFKRLEFGERTYRFALKFPEDGRHRVQILAGKRRGLLCKANRNAREVVMSATMKGPGGGPDCSGSLAFSNNTAADISLLAGGEFQFPAGYGEITVNLELRSRDRELQKETASEWNVSVLDFYVYVDGRPVNDLYVRERTVNIPPAL